METTESKTQPVPIPVKEKFYSDRPSQKLSLTPLLPLLGILAVVGIAYGAYGYGRRSGKAFPAPQPTSLTSSPTGKPAENNDQLALPTVLPFPLPTARLSEPKFETVNIKNLIPSQMDFEYSLFVDLDGDEQQELILVGKDNKHQAPKQVGGDVGMPLVQVYQFNSQLRGWELRVEINDADFRGATGLGNASLLKNAYMVSFRKSRALVFTYHGSSSRVNEWFTAIIGSGTGIKAYPFPRDTYKEHGGKTPHAVTLFSNGPIEVKEGIYQGTDANCCPSGGTLVTTFTLSPEGIEHQNTIHQESNLTF